ncbi:MAG: fused DSP-PTPase phosphatase/NAD kinase-like protein [Sarcina sp.]
MKKRNFFMIIIIIMFFTLNLNLFTIASDKEIKKIKDSIKIENQLPKNFYYNEMLSISSSGQFNEKQLENLMERINEKRILIVDLRMESHGFINGESFYFEGTEIERDGLLSNEIFVEEIKDLEKIKEKKNIDLYNENKKILEKIEVIKMKNEAEVVYSKNLEYMKLAIKKGEVPSMDVVDNFINIFKNKPKDVHLHFHCDNGSNRSKMLLIMWEIINNSKIDFNELISEMKSKYNYSFEDKKQEGFFVEFYNYVRENEKNNFEIAYSIWRK